MLRDFNDFIFRDNKKYIIINIVINNQTQPKIAFVSIIKANNSAEINKDLEMKLELFIALMKQKKNADERKIVKISVKISGNSS